MSEDTEAVRWVVTGRVQGVWFRDFTRREAHALGLRGWVRNLADGSVEAWVVGERGSVAKLKQRLREGPPLARVDGIAEEALEPAAVTDVARDFEVRY